MYKSNNVNSRDQSGKVSRESEVPRGQWLNVTSPAPLSASSSSSSQSSYNLQDEPERQKEVDRFADLESGESAETACDREGGKYSSARDVAVSLVEIVFVLIEYSYWIVYQIYAYDLKELFNIAPTEVVRRALFSLLPGHHAPLLQKPDFYGPMVAVFALPQVLLLCMGASASGCDRSDLLGNSVVVSLCLWGGLSFIYRLLSYVIAPTIELKHCLCMTGYSLFSWIMALLVSYPLEVYEDIFGLPGEI